MTKPTIEPDFIRQLAGILNDTDLTEIEVEQEGLRIRLARQVEVPTQVSYAMPQMAPMAAPVAAPAVASVPAAAPAAADPAASANAVRSVIVGTAYLSPEPGARPFISVGDVVRAGQTLLIVEAMKHMNQIAAPRAGKVTHILVKDGDPVEFDQALVVVE